MKKRMVRPMTRQMMKHLVASVESNPKSTMIESDSLTEALHLAAKGDSIYKLVKVGRVGKDGKYHPVKKRKR